MTSYQSPMFQHGLNTNFTKRATFHWYLLSVLSGSVNAGAFLACQRFATHVTGFATLAGVALARSDWAGSVGMLSAPLYFLSGVMIAAWLTSRQKSLGRRPHYATTMTLVAVCLVAAAIAGKVKAFGVFGNDFDLSQNYVLLALLCMASGLQNAAITTSSGASVRTTHLTGLTTDLGIGLIDALTHPSGSDLRQASLRRNRLRVGTIASFILGSALGAFLFLEFSYLGFLFPGALAIYAALIARRYRAPTATSAAIQPAH